MKKKILSLVTLTGLALGTITPSIYARDLDLKSKLNNEINSDIAIGDVTGDSKPDIVYVGNVTSLEDVAEPDYARRKMFHIEVLQNLGDGSFRRHITYAQVPITDKETHLRIADVDGDGRNDIIAKTGDELVIFKNIAKPYWRFEKKEFSVKDTYDE